VSLEATPHKSFKLHSDRISIEWILSFQIYTAGNGADMYISPMYTTYMSL